LADEAIRQMVFGTRIDQTGVRNSIQVSEAGVGTDRQLEDNTVLATIFRHISNSLGNRGGGRMYFDGFTADDDFPGVSRREAEDRFSKLRAT
jgi:hypothetical protein